MQKKKLRLTLLKKTIRRYPKRHQRQIARASNSETSNWTNSNKTDDSCEKLMYIWKGSPITGEKLGDLQRDVRELSKTHMFSFERRHVSDRFDGLRPKLVIFLSFLLPLRCLWSFKACLRLVNAPWAHRGLCFFRVYCMHTASCL
jgi:hypothetical protein